MSARLERAAVELAWKQWTALGVAGTARPARQGIDLEALIAFMPFIAASEPRLADESWDWCARIGKSFVSISRLRQIVRLMPPRQTHDFDLAALLISRKASPEKRLSRKSRAPSLRLPSLVQLRSRHIFGLGARADIITRLAMRDRPSGPQRPSRIRPVGYTKQAVGVVLDELAEAGVLEKFEQTNSVSYELARAAPLRSLLAPLPGRMPPWAERLVLVANLLEAWRRYGSRSSYVIELTKTLDRLRSIASAAGELPGLSGRPKEVVGRIDSWALTLLNDDVWESSWTYEGEDITHEILMTLYDSIVDAVHSGDYPVGYTELEDLAFKNIDRKDGTGEFTVQFTAEHPKEDFSFAGHVDGDFKFDPEAETKDALVESFEVTEANEHFDMGDPDD